MFEEAVLRLDWEVEGRGVCAWACAFSAGELSEMALRRWR
jgi:hypothetical protein